MTELTYTQQRLLAVHDCLRRGVDPRDGHTPIDLVERNSDNETWIHDEWQRLTGENIGPGGICGQTGCAWCAACVSVAGYLAHAIDLPDFSLGAWAIVDHLKSKGLGLDHPEVGAACAFSEGAGHVTTLLHNVSGTTWVCGDGNWGDCYQWVTRDLATQPIYGYARLPGIDAELKAIAKPDTPPPPAPPAPFGGHPIVQWIGHRQIWLIDKEWVITHGWRYTKAQIPPAQLPAAEKHAGQGVFRIGDVGSVRLKKLRTVPYTGA